jgi:hypothetical protein
MQRWVGLCLIADNIVNIGRTMDKLAGRQARSVNPIGKPAGNTDGCCRDPLTTTPKTSILEVV